LCLFINVEVTSCRTCAVRALHAAVEIFSGFFRKNIAKQ
jgi:hypothetical protein